MKSDNHTEKMIIDAVNSFLKKYKKKISRKDLNSQLLNDILDSLDFVNLIIKLEKIFKIKFPINKVDTSLTINKINSHDVDLKKIIISVNKDLLEKYNWFYIPKRNANYLKRNAIIALSNNPNLETYQFYLEIYKTLPDDLKNYILWGFWKLGKINEISSLMDKENSDDLKLEYEKLKSMTS